MSIASRPRSGTTYGRGETIVVQVGFNEPVTVTGAPELALTLGSVTRSAAFVRSAERSLWFRYRVGGDDRDADGIGIAAAALTLNGGTITDRTGNAAQLDLGPMPSRAPPDTGWMARWWTASRPRSPPSR